MCRGQDTERLFSHILQHPNLNEVDSQKRSLLHWASFFGWSVGVKALLDAGIDKNLIDVDGANAMTLLWATKAKFTEENGLKCLELLLCAGVDPEVS